MKSWPVAALYLAVALVVGFESGLLLLLVILLALGAFGIADDGSESKKGDSALRNRGSRIRSILYDHWLVLCSAILSALLARYGESLIDFVSNGMSVKPARVVD